DANEVSVPSPVQAEQVTQLLRVEGHLADEAASEWPDRMVAGETPVIVRVRPEGMPKLRRSDVLRVVTVGHTVYDDEPNAFVEDVVTRTDLADEALVAVARANPHVPLLALKRAATIFTQNDVPYSAEGYTTLAEWDIGVIFTRQTPANELAQHVYDVEFYPTTGRVAAEWTLTLDLDRGEVRDLVLYDIAPEP
ncbi:MAG: hypothetical protein GVY14_09475, partial [Spirochaetes bacterium]|nr:hypothetical protein [Spirochaetota bacterium]